jgi:Carboxypeptidase regulatory-like domain
MEMVTLASYYIMRYTFLSILMVFSLFLTVSAQELRTVEGKVVDTARSAVTNASILLFYETPGDTLKTISNSLGEFRFSQVKNRPFTVRVSFTGFTQVEKKVDDVSSGKINVGSLPLFPSYASLQEIIVSSPTIQVKEDTIDYKADSFKVKPNAMVEDLLKKLPGVSVDKDGNVTAQGKQVTRVKVNGKDFFSGNVQTATRELSADMIDKVQVIDDYGDQSNFSGIRDGEPEKILNLQLKKDKNKGMFGRITAGGGDQDRYQVIIIWK